MADLTPFYLSARERQQNDLDRQAGSEALAMYGTPQTPSEPIAVNTDVNAIDTSKIPGQRPRTGPAPEPQGGLKLQNVPEPLSRSRQGQPELSTEALVEQRVPYSDALNTLIEYIANSENPEEFRQKMIEAFKKDPRNFEAGMEQLLTALQINTPHMNTIMHAVKTELQAAGAPDWAATAGEYMVGALIPSRMAMGRGGHLAGEAVRPAAKFGAAAIERARAVMPSNISPTEVGRSLAGDLEKGSGFSYGTRFRPSHA